MDEKEKYKSSKYTVINTWKIYVLFLAPLITSIGVLAFLVRKSDLTFDNQEQKYEIINHPKSEVKHMNFSEKSSLKNANNRILKIELRQESLIKKVDEESDRSKDVDRKMGGDLDQIKRKIDKLIKK